MIMCGGSVNLMAPLDVATTATTLIAATTVFAAVILLEQTLESIKQTESEFLATAIVAGVTAIASVTTVARITGFFAGVAFFFLEETTDAV